MDKRETVLESIKKLLSLGVSDDEIAENLYDVGIEKPEAFSLIREARGVPKPIVQAAAGKNQSGKVSVSQNSSSKTSEDLFEETVNELSMNDQIVQQLPIAKNVSQEEGISVKSKQQNSQITQASQIAQAAQLANAAKASDDIANRIMSDVAKQDGEDFEDEEDVEELDDEGNAIPSEKKETPAPISSAPIPPAQKVVVPSVSQPKPIPTQAPKPVQEQKVVSQVQSSQVNNSQPSQSAPTQIPKAQVFSSTAIPEMDFTIPQSQKYNKVPEMSPDFEELWKKGIVVAVNAKLAEMKKLKEEVNYELTEKVDEAVRKELYQFKVLLDSQKDLIVSSNKEALEQKQKEIVFIIDSKIAELKQYNRQIADNLASMETVKKQQETAMSQIGSALDDAKRTRSQLIVELNSEMIKSKSQAQSFLDTASMQLKQMDERVNKTLELEKNIADGMLQQAEQKIETLAIQRADELISTMEVEVNRLQSISKKISPETLDQKIQVLEEFKKQFLNNMQENLAQINAAIEQLNQKNAYAERELAEKTLAIDAKLEELTKFEKQFTEVMDKAMKKK